ncbi:hydrolase 76 protein [Globomyces sp. JEL0801]|nr:hydrolase 76 protein [Globomyces sp. JEL0801]
MLNQLGVFLIATNTVMAIKLDVNDQQAMLKAAQGIAKNLMNYYVPGKTASQGTILPNTAKTAQGGIMWGVMMDYMKATGDQQYSTAVVNGLTLASYGPTASFLGKTASIAETLEGKWNDDILWWALGPVTGAEIFGKDTVMPGGVSYSKLAKNTWDQVWNQWDDSCQGGLWWSRDRKNVKSKGYKSTITHGQQMVLGSRLAILTGDKTLAEASVRMYQWLKKTGIITPQFKVRDGLDVDQKCGINPNELSYKSGFVFGGLAWTYKALGDESLMTEAASLFKASLDTFTKNKIITDQCEPKCDENQVSPKGTYVRSVGYLYENTKDASLQNLIKDTLKASVTAMLDTCDDKFTCGNNWSTASPPAGPSVHYQINSLELITAYYKTFLQGGQSEAKFQPPSTAPVPVAPKDDPNSSADHVSIISTSSLIGSMILSLLIL